MEFLPKVSSEFSSKEYWEKFFKQSSAFEWYGNYFDLCGVLSRYIKKNDTVLVPGCGNSELSQQLYDNGMRSIANVDISETVIKQMEKKNADRVEMTYAVMDLQSLSFDDNKFSVVLDKGTLDALMTDNTKKTHDMVDKIFQEYTRVIKIGGRYICITLAQDQILKKLVSYFAQNDWLVRVHNIAVDVSESKMPVFAFVMTKFKKLPQLMLELCLVESEKPKRVSTVNEIVDAVKSSQYYAIVREKLNKKVKLEDDNEQQPHLDLYAGNDSLNPRYEIFVVDRLHYNPKQLYGIFIVPQGKESDWIFSTKEGRENLAKSANFQRLAVVLLNDHHCYKDMQQIHDELSRKVLEISPPKLPESYKVPFLSEGQNEIGERVVKFRGSSDITGPYVIEDYMDKDGTWFRHLIFTAQNRTVQCEVRLKIVKKQHGCNHMVDNLQPDYSYLASEYAEAIATGVIINHSPNESLDILILGFGGGTLGMFLLQNCANAKVCGVEIDSNIIEIANKWFKVPKAADANKRLNIVIEDALKYVNEQVEIEDEIKKYDSIVIDIDSKDVTTGIGCPPRQFVSETFIKTIKQLLKPAGILYVNLLCRNNEIKQEVLGSLKPQFEYICMFKGGEYVNDVLFCYLKKPAVQPVQRGNKKHKKGGKSKKGCRPSNSHVAELEPDAYFNSLCENWLQNLKQWKEWRQKANARKIDVDMHAIIKSVSPL